jgi:HEAT repeat protein
VSDPLLDRLVVDGMVTRAEADEATGRQAAAGGALDTALLELRLVPGARIPELLARVSGLPAPPESAFTSPDPRARRVFPAKVAERHGIAPFALDGRDLSVVTTYPPDAALLDEIGFMLSLRLRTHVAPEWRVRQLITQLYGCPLPGRLADLASGAERPEPEPPEVEPLPEEEAPDPAAGRAPGWTPAAAREAVERAADPDAAIRALLRAARDHFSFAAAFTVRREGLTGHDALGVDPRAREACRRLSVEAHRAGLFGAPLATRAPYLGPPPSDPVTASVLAGLGRVGPHTVLVAPVWVGDRAACVLYADNDDAPVASGRLADLFPLLATLGDALARMIRARKAEGRTPAAPRPAPEPASEAVPDLLEPLPAAEAEPPAEAEPALATPVEAEPVGEAPPAEAPVDEGPVVPRGTAAAAPGESWQVSEPARVEPDPLPFSVDVDLGEYEVISASQALATGRAEDVGALVEALAASAAASADREDLLARLAEGGPEAGVALVARLPGPLEARASLAGPDPVEAWGPVFAGVVALGRPAEKPLLAALEDPDPERRRAALALLSRLGLPAALPAIAACAHDEDPRVASEAAHALAAARGAPELAPIVADLRRALTSGRTAKAARAARALARLGDADAVPLLIQLLDAGGELPGVAADALTAITLQRLGHDSTPWIAWWREWRAAPRSSWLFQALTGPDEDLRRTAATELRRAGEPPEPYDADGPAPEREKAARAWARWWRDEGLAL